ncbi:hypothetical protein RSAG8_13800, partial [Rhizoctonia solani AG-8 WAC10335]
MDRHTFNLPSPAVTQIEYRTTTLQKPSSIVQQWHTANLDTGSVGGQDENTYGPFQ